MKIALLGGTGDIGEGLALRWGRDSDYELVIGSRDPGKAEQRAADYCNIIDDDCAATIEGKSNAEAAADGDVVILSVPPEHLVDTLKSVEDKLTAETIVVSPAVMMNRDQAGFHYSRPEVTDSITAKVEQAVPNDVPVVGAFHNLPANRLATLDAELGLDTVIVADDQEAGETIKELADDIDGLRAVHGGSIGNAADVEAITPLLINLAMNNDGMHGLGVRFK